MTEQLQNELTKRPEHTRAKRVKRFKKIICILLFLLILLPSILCIFLFARMNRLEYQLEEAIQVREVKLQEKQKVENEQLAAKKTETTNLRKEVERKGLPLEHKYQGYQKVYLTFDDGPSSYTDEILDILKEYHVKATFFVVGKEKPQDKKLYQRIVQEGHTLGMHSYSHKYNEIYQSVPAFTKDMEKLQDLLFQTTGTKPNLLRFPGGSSNQVSKTDIQDFITSVEQAGVTYFDWNISSGDAQSGMLSAQEIYQNSVAKLGEYKTHVILMHDSANKRTTVEALPLIIERILAQENTVILPITAETQPIQHIKSDRTTK